jgi:DNA-binding Xre family transcriptional regulator
MISKRISYRPLWQIMVDRQLPKSYLCFNDTGVHITTKSLSRLSKDEGVSIAVLLRVCCILGCDICDICETITYDVEDSEIIYETEGYWKEIKLSSGNR